MEKIFITKNLNELENVVNYILTNLTVSKMILLNGELGSGKTALVKVLAKLIGIKDTIVSPTFNYMKIYEGLVHIDAYNLTEDLSEFEDYFDDNIVAIEWPEKIKIYNNNYLNVFVSVNSKDEHIYKIVKYEKDA
ncbi:tRNA (adenosine(37)-N6)-threonylcarbamoyltransferase complex ATPase subunit type 1 TsaE [Mycoplasmopsis columbina]|uniref:tRNA (adenosine(37)-N6)-threonylcarbamoyltransferase complex ATPase subunit type 1 TsaE n=1 Tax=Mycoplasmopsis columbina TaxID=114881 RepID=UPI0004A7342F|nr:tRNA (adenosine(37)-N6)-threonylcarbamoyltransferase complex ATPase subunit type 1 TsaE [Mycoplasmopsis columbina]VEU77109.1 ATPase or kinase [Mycoplasmopsis columbina]